MEFDQLLAEILAELRREGRIAFRVLKRRHALTDDDLEDIKADLIDAKRLARDEDGKVLVWAGEPDQDAPALRSAAPVTYTPQHLAARIRAQQQALEARGGQEGERKTITVLFADLKGSTAMLEGLDPEVARGVIDPALQLMMNAVHRYEGYVAQALGDGILALFGAPLAHEDHAQRAVYAALAMQEEMRRYADRVRLTHGVSLAMRVGLNTGEVVVRSIRRDDLHTDYVPVGHSINLAARMEQMAAPGSVLITDTTARLVEGYFNLKSLGDTAIKGVTHALGVYEVTGVGQLRTRLQVAARRGLTPFVGRQHELEQMKLALARVREGHGQVIGVMGEAGLGKSRLVLEFKAQAQGFAVFEAYSASHGKASPYLPIVELLKGYFQIQVTDDEQTRREKVIGKILGLDRQLVDVLPYYFALLNIEDPDSPLPQMDPQTRRRRTFEALKRATFRASVEQPLLLIYEDLHWIDSETQGFLDSLVESLGSARILLLTNYRPEYRHEWGAKTYCTQLRLAPFGRREAEEFAAALLGGNPASGEPREPLAQIRQLVLARAEGTPFFMEELVQELFEQGVLVRDATGRALPQGVVDAQMLLPTTVQGVLAARIDRLAPEEKSLLQTLAVIGREFTFGLVRRIVAASEEGLYALLEALQRKEFLYEQPALPDIQYVFKHALTQEVAYNTLLLEHRRRLHQQAAEVIEEIYQHELEDHFASLAHHYSRSGNDDRAIDYLERAGLQAMKRSAVADAAAYLGDALAFFERLPLREARLEQELRVAIALIPAVHMNKGMASDELRTLCFHARSLCEKAGREQDLVPILGELRTHYCVRGDCREAMNYAEALFVLAQRHAQRRDAVQAHSAMTISLMIAGRFDGALEHARCLREIYDPAQDHKIVLEIGFDPLALSLGCEICIHWKQGSFVRARQAEEEMTKVVTEVDHPHVHGLGLYLQTFHASLRGDARNALLTGEALIQLAMEHQFPDWLLYGRLLSGWALECEGRREGLEMLEGACAVLAQTRAELNLPYFLGLLAHAQLIRGDFVKARAAVEAAFEVAERNHEHIWDAGCHVMLGEIHLAEAGPSGAGIDHALACFRRGIALAEDSGAKSWALRAALGLARALVARGEHGVAREQLHAIRATFDDADAPDLRAADALLARLAAV